MRLLTKTLLGAFLLVSATASARTVIVPAAVGHYVPPLLGVQTQNDWFLVENNKVCGRLNTERYWDTPLVLNDFTGGIVNVYARRSTHSTSTSKSNAYTSDENGNIFDFSGAKTNNEHLGNVMVPENGTLFAESLLNDNLDDVGGCVYQFKVIY